MKEENLTRKSIKTVLLLFVCVILSVFLRDDKTESAGSYLDNTYIDTLLIWIRSFAECSPSLESPGLG